MKNVSVKCFDGPLLSRLTLQARGSRMNVPTEKRPTSKEDQKLFSYLRMFLLPTLSLKVGLLYFGLNYTQYPDEGYGYGLLIVIFLSLVNAGIFLWKNWSDAEGFSK